MYNFKDGIYISENNNKRALFPSIKFYYDFVKIIYKSWTQVQTKSYNSKNWELSSYNIEQALENVGVKFEITGVENLSKIKNTAVLVSNHMSSLETVVLPSVVNPIKKVVFIMKEELLSFPFFGPVTGARFPVVVGRKNPREDLLKVLKDGKERLENGRSIIVFPQKTRSRYVDLGSFNTIGIKLAKSSNAEVVPVALLTDAWSTGKYIKDFGRILPEKTVKITFGTPFNVTNPKEAHEKVLEFIKNKFYEWGKEEFIIEQK